MDAAQEASIVLGPPNIKESGGNKRSGNGTQHPGVRSRLHSVVGHLVSLHPHELPNLLHASAAFFFLLSAYFVVLPFRDEAAISLGTSVLPSLFIASMVLTLAAAPVSSYFLSLPYLSKTKALLLMYRFFGCSLVLFFILYSTVPIKISRGLNKGFLGWLLQNLKLQAGTATLNGENSTWSFTAVRVCFFIWIALLNLFTTSAMWARLADVMNSEAGSRLFGFVGAGATLGQLAGSLLAVVLAPIGPFLLLLSAVLMEFAARCSLGIGEEAVGHDDARELTNLPLDSSNIDQQHSQADSESKVGGFPRQSQLAEVAMPSKLSSLLEGLRLILASSYLLHVCCFLWLTAIVSSFFYFQRANVVAGTVQDALGRRTLLAKMNSLTAIFILLGQLTVTGRILTGAGITVALCASPVVAFINMTAIAISPTATVVAFSEASRKVVTYVITRPGREVLFTVITREEKYKAKVCIDTCVQRLGDAAAAGIYKLFESFLLLGPAAAAVWALPVCIAWLVAAVSLGRRQMALAKGNSSST